MKVIIINGPNLNLLGTREPEIYGSDTLENIQKEVNSNFTELKLTWHQSNLEGEIVSLIQQANKAYDAIVINPAGYSHTSVSILDALSMLNIPIVEVHLSNVYKREDFRSTMLTAKASDALIAGCGKEGYSLALKYIMQLKRN